MKVIRKDQTIVTIPNWLIMFGIIGVVDAVNSVTKAITTCIKIGSKTNVK